MPWSDSLDGRPARHARVWLDRSSWKASLIGPLDAAACDLLDDWIARGRALVARRSDALTGHAVAVGRDVRKAHHDAGRDANHQAGDEPGHGIGGIDHDGACGLAVALPLAYGRSRIALTIDRRAIVRIAPPLRLDEAIHAAPPDWRTALCDLLDRAVAVETVFHVYGSVAWQSISGEPCTTAASDIDLLWSAAAAPQIRRVLEVLTAWEARHGLRADGEVLLADGGAVAWRELIGDPERVIVKQLRGVSLRPSPLRPSLLRSAPSSSAPQQPASMFAGIDVAGFDAAVDVAGIDAATVAGR